MKNLKVIATVLFLSISLLGYSQKVKLKKGEVLVDDVVWMNYQECGSFDSTCSLLNKNKTQSQKNIPTVKKSSFFVEKSSKNEKYTKQVKKKQQKINEKTKKKKNSQKNPEQKNSAASTRANKKEETEKKSIKKVDQLIHPIFLLLH